jgi:hypothetical protein
MQEPAEATGLKGVLERLPPRVAVALAIIAALAWAGPGFREALQGMLYPSWVRPALAWVYLCGVAFSFGWLVYILALPLWTYRDQKLSQQQLEQFMAETLDLGDSSEQASALCQRVFLAETTDEREALGLLALEYLVTVASLILKHTASVHRSVLFVPDGDGLIPLPGARYGFDEGELDGVGLPADGTSIAGYAYATRKPYVAQPAGNDPHLHVLPGREAPASVLCVPVLGSQGEPLAVLSVDSDRDDAFVPENMAQMRVIASRVSDVLVALASA